ncbi:hypothetical protein NPIL_58271 [Nephila pilipes]|uniref:Uncharacterized protein n=1 Tax=Nephila pilipes TaxID=299642 RepID=A0A8X6TKF8_NEPPI|nr:hypothetical protein NPIL_58271 [Nephila pilipes]
MAPYLLSAAVQERERKKGATGILDLCKEPSVACREPASHSDEINLRLRRGRHVDVKDWRRLFHAHSFPRSASGLIFFRTQSLESINA